jgi:hypothetical protein
MKNQLRRGLATGLLFGLVVFAPACTLSQVNAWRTESGRAPIAAGDPDAPAIVEAATAWVAEQAAAARPEPLSIRDAVWQAAEREKGWGHGAEWGCLQGIVGRETGETWNPHAQHPHSTAYGLFGFLNSTWGPTGVAKTSDPAGQTVAAVRYIAARYGTPCQALAFHRSRGWY